jgi:hypothetical protein
MIVLLLLVIVLILAMPRYHRFLGERRLSHILIALVIVIALRFLGLAIEFLISLLPK